MELTAPATVACALACLCLYVAVLTLRLSRASGWQSQRWLAVAAVSAGVYIIGDIPQTLDVSMATILAACRIQMVASSATAIGWLYFSEASLGLERTRTQTAVTVALVALSTFSLIPGGMFVEGELLTVHVPWAGITYRMGNPTVPCLVTMFMGCVGAFIAALRLARAAYRGHREHAWHAFALFAFLGAAVNDSLITAGVYASIILIDFFYLLPVAAIAMTQTSALVQISLNLEKANGDLVEALRAANEATRLKGEFLANVSHELRTPLNSIINIPEGLLEQVVETELAVCKSCGDRFATEGTVVDSETACPSCASRGSLTISRGEQIGADPSEVAGHLRHLVRAGKHLLGVVNDILDFSKLDAGKMALHVEELSAQTLLDDLGKFIEPLARQRQVALTCAARPANMTLHGDARKLMQVLLNLASNAMKFSAVGTTVDIAIEGEADGTRITVRDHGVGIAPENHALVFEAFRQVDGSHTRAVGGTGLGLSVVRKLVELHGGTITLESALGRGSTFTIWLPRPDAVIEGARDASLTG